MIEKSTWGAFREAGLLWWINRGLHLFGWAIVVDVDEDGEVTDCYPARCGFRGFSEESETRGFAKLTAHLEENLERMKEDL